MRGWAAFTGALALAAGGGCGDPALELRPASEAGSAADQTVVVDCLGYPQVAPLELVLNCRKFAPWVRSLKWHQWGQSRTSAAGYVVQRGESPVRVRVELSGLTLRRDATVTYRTATVTAARTVAGWGTSRVSYALQEGAPRRARP